MLIHRIPDGIKQGGFQIYEINLCWYKNICFDFHKLPAVIIPHGQIFIHFPPRRVPMLKHIVATLGILAGSTLAAQAAERFEITAGIFGGTGGSLGGA